MLHPFARGVRRMYKGILARSGHIRFDHAASIDFIKVTAMAVTNQAQSRLLLGSNATDRMMRLAAGQAADGARSEI